MDNGVWKTLYLRDLESSEEKLTEGVYNWRDQYITFGALHP